MIRFVTLSLLFFFLNKDCIIRTYVPYIHEYILHTLFAIQVRYYNADIVNQKLTSIIDFEINKSIMNMKIICCCFLLKTNQVIFFNTMN